MPCFLIFFTSINRLFIQTHYQETVLRNFVTKTLPTILILGCILFSLTCPAQAKDAMQGPWDSWKKSSKAPVADNTVFKTQTGEFSYNPLLWGVRLFRNFISSVDGPRCSMYPTCSHYSLLAFKKHGPVMGYILTTDRLIHESDEPRYVPRVEKHNVIRFYDPLENNDFWWDDDTPGKKEEKEEH